MFKSSRDGHATDFSSLTLKSDTLPTAVSPNSLNNKLDSHNTQLENETTKTSFRFTGPAYSPTKPVTDEIIREVMCMLLYSTYCF